MTWFKVDDGFYDHPKVDELSLAAVGLWTMAGTYSARHLTDGHIPYRRIAKLGGDAATAGELVAAGLWADVGDGYLFNDWHDYQPTRAEVLGVREKERQRKAAQRRGVPAGVPVGQPVGHRAESHPESHAESRQDSTWDSGHPDPTRPDPTIEEQVREESSADADASPALALIEKTPPARPRTNPDDEPDDEIRALCQLLADRLDELGVKHGYPSRRWHADMRKMRDIDGRTPDEIAGAIRWALADGCWWQPNIHSPQKLREKFDQMRLSANRDRPRNTTQEQNLDLIARLKAQEAG